MKQAQAMKVARYNWLKKQARCDDNDDYTDAGKNTRYRHWIAFHSPHKNFEHALTEAMKSGRRKET